MPKTKIKHGFGRIYKPDEKDKLFLMTKILPLTSEKTEQFWNDDGFWYDQGNQPICVGAAWAHWVEDAPIEHEGCIDPVWIYKEAQKEDDIPGEFYEGTTVRGGAQALQKGKGLISNYYWADSVDDIILALLELGPVTVGTNWYKGMSNPDAEGMLKVTGALEGGHAYVLNGVDTVKGIFRMKNSWGRLWGKEGRAFIKISDFAKLMPNGEACLATEVANPAPPPPEPSLWERFLKWFYSWWPF